MPSSRVRLISEPHVAAMHVFETLETHIPPGSAFVLCDAGGGTVDVVSFRFCGRNPHVELQEIGSATGGQYGSVNLDSSFRKTLTESYTLQLDGAMQFATPLCSGGNVRGKESSRGSARRA